ESHETPLMSAIHLGHLPLVQQLLDWKADVSSKAVLHIAASEGNADILAALLSTDYNFDLDSGYDSNSGDDQKLENFLNNSPLYLAVLSNKVAATWILLKAGANPNPADPDSPTPLASAAFRGNTQMCRMLLKAGANISTGVNSPLKAAAVGNCLEPAR